MLRLPFRHFVLALAFALCACQPGNDHPSTPPSGTLTRDSTDSNESYNDARYDEMQRESQTDVKAPEGAGLGASTGASGPLPLLR